MIGLGSVAVINRKTYSRVVCERRFMLSATIATSIATVLFIVAMSLPEWVTVETHMPAKNETELIKVAIWGERVRVNTNGDLTRDEWIWHFPSPPEAITRLHLGEKLPHYYRTQAVFGCIAVLLMIAANSCAIYSLAVHRYMYKRLTSGLHFVTALCILIVIEVMVHSMDQWHHASKQENPAKQTGEIQRVQYSYSTVISWFDFAIYAVASVIFIVGSRKRKGSRAATQEFEVEDRPFELGRV